jgi:hypothetical protein
MGLQAWAISGLITISVPGINAAAAVWILDEAVTVRIVVAGVMMLGGLYVAQRYSE